MELTISIVIPVYNGAKTIGHLTEKLVELLGNRKLQIVLVNDGSKDKSHEICRDMALKYASIITYINLSKNFGEHNAVMAGLNYVKGDYVVIMDDDFQNLPEEVSMLFDEAINKKYDILYTFYRKKEHDWFRNLGSYFNNWVANFMLDKPKDLYLSSFKCLSRFVVKEIIKYKGPFPYIDGLALRCTRNIGKIEVHHEKRKEGQSGYTLRKLINLWLNMFVNFSIIPLRLSSWLGILFSILGGILSILVVIEKVLKPHEAIGWPSLIIAIMIFSGVQLLILGLLGEYLGRLFLSDNQTPQFLVYEVFNDTDN
ncbi:MAG TPA: glycosyltransferase family 2 protein [Candidatus Eremiobacteraeota bacterium]|nr:MAG: Undecaprenyl-phosphate 4-deoxy-4-formamido-L-arabinose transferase [bacterium ADurb.Bin363]HPZ08151.1 glycosyltransferase family 2 protein [Candidatus Eremiobacteraeota bacterium]